MTLAFEDRPSDSPFVEKVWRSRSDRGGPFVSIAQCHFEMAVTRHLGRTFITLRGPETQATRADCPPDGEWLGIRFKLGTFMPRVAPADLRDRNDVTLPGAAQRSFWLNGSACEYPDFENADTFVDRLVRKGLIVRDPIVDAVLRGAEDARSIRSAQRHFLRATGITHGTVRQIERARRATMLLRDGVPILGRRPRRGLLRPGPPDAFAQAPHRADAAGGEPDGGAAVVSIQNTARPVRVAMRAEAPLMHASTPGSTRTHVRAAYALTTLAALFLALDTVMKLLRLAPAVEGTVALGYPDHTVVVIGAIELVCLVLYLVPQTAVLGAVLMTGYLGGAIATHVRLGNPLLSHTLFPIYVAVMVWGGLYLREPRLRALMPIRRA